MDLGIKEKLALVSGSTAGIGMATARALANDGASVIINGRSEAAVAAAIEILQPQVSGNLLGFAGDLAKPETIDRLAAQYPKVDILVNNLGIFEPAEFADISDQDWYRFFEVNVMSGIRLSRLYLPGMKEQNWGRIIFVSSESAVQIPAEMIHYGMTKTAQLAVARGMAESLAGTGITVNSVLPGPTRSRGVVDFVNQLAKDEGKSFEQFEQEFFEKVRPSSLIQRFAAPDEVASMIAYLCSSLASATTGAAVRADGGVVRAVV
ncbi:SDR family NAD(P)-dependent oxidoreductase [Oceanobacter mangrovi]|uniref:SDR family NAD(P)-dependent oxidoreductase n=1 Tax=Oceanobacter mangrovi TaxID=2862510 RepID=UPI001C8EB2C3|nr:SDR family oxidoreductase [Oceanobacter mangrovi]